MDKKRRDFCYKPLLLVLTLMLIMPMLPACSGVNVNEPSETEINNNDNLEQIPVITPQIIGNPNLNLIGTTTDIQVISQDGATFENDGISIVVPPLAVSEDTTLTLKEFTQHPPTSPLQSDSTSLPEAISISNVYDLGPDGVTFDQPVTITLDYDKSLLNDDVDESKIFMAYYNGNNWIAAGGLVDTYNGTVTASLTSFHGIAIGLFVATALAVTSVSYAVYHWYDNRPDPLAQGEAKNYVVPNSPIVAQYTSEAGLLIPQTTKGGSPTFIPLEDPNNPGQFNPKFLTSNLKSIRIGFNTDPFNLKGLDYPKNLIEDANGNDTNWTPPDQYFQNGMVGECTCIGNAYLSMFRRLGIEAYGVEGYKNNSNVGQGLGRHAWVELLLDGKPYYYDDDEGLKPLQDVESKLVRQGDIRGDGMMWNEQGQKPYQQNWWKSVATPQNTPSSSPTLSNQSKLLNELQTCQYISVNVKFKSLTPFNFDYFNIDNSDTELTWNGASFSATYTAPDIVATFKGTISADGQTIIQMQGNSDDTDEWGNKTHQSFTIVNVPIDWDFVDKSQPFSAVGPYINLPQDSKYFSSINETFTSPDGSIETFKPDLSSIDNNCTIWFKTKTAYSGE